METVVRQKISVCEKALNAEWDDVVASAADRLDDAQRAFLSEHPPGLVMALWDHFDVTREECGCTSPTHERADCTVRFIERLLLDEESA